MRWSQWRRGAPFFLTEFSRRICVEIFLLSDFCLHKLHSSTRDVELREKCRSFGLMEWR